MANEAARKTVQDLLNGGKAPKTEKPKSSQAMRDQARAAEMLEAVDFANNKKAADDESAKKKDSEAANSEMLDNQTEKNKAALEAAAKKEKEEGDAKVNTIKAEAAQKILNA